MVAGQTRAVGRHDFQTNWAGLSIWWIAEFCTATTEKFGFCLQLNVDFQTNDNFVGEFTHDSSGLRV